MRSRALRVSSVVFGLATAIACVTAEGSFQEKGLSRAAFELDCPASELTVTVLHRNDGLGCAGSTVGVEGCGKKAVYVCDRSQSWYNNTGDAEGKAEGKSGEPDAKAE